MRSNGPLANKEVAIGGHGWPWVARSSGVAESGRLVRRMSHHVDPAAIAEKLEPCGWMPFSGLPDGPFRWGIVQRQIADSDSVNHGSNPGLSARESASNRCVFVVSS